MAEHGNDTAEVVKDKKDKDKNVGSFDVTVRTPAGFAEQFRVTHATKVDTLTRRAVEHFVNSGQLAAGGYRLVLLRDGESTDLAASGRLGESGVRDGDVLALVTTDAQVDG